MTARPLHGPIARRRRPHPALLLAGGISLLFFSLGACIVEERNYDPQLDACTEYCRLVDDACQDENKVYDHPEACLAVCLRMDLGEGTLGGSDRKNTVACRIEKLQQSEFQARDCATVGPGGGGECGSNCEAFCSLRQQVCTGVAGQTYEDDLQLDKCLSNCQAMPDLLSFDAGNRDQHGDSLQCRLVHVSEAAISKSKALTHCLHTQTVPKGADTFPCSDAEELSADDNCTRYCEQVMGACQGEFALYTNTDECKAVCKVLEPGDPGDTDENTVRCRRYHSYNALDEGPSIHCTHAGPTGDGHCGADNCESYCTILSNACPTKFQAQYGADPAAGGRSCRSSCAALKGASANSFQTFENGVRYSVNPPPQGNNLLCRTYHAVTALAKAKDDLECEAAFGAAPCGP
jgi:hypothetical protein